MGRPDPVLGCSLSATGAERVRGPARPWLRGPPVGAHRSPGTCCVSPDASSTTSPTPGRRARLPESAEGRGWGLRRCQPFPACHPHPNSAAVTWCVAWEGEKRRDFFGCSESPVVLQLQRQLQRRRRAWPGRTTERSEHPGGSREPRRGRCGRRGRHLRLLSPAAVAWAASARAPETPAATAAAARAASAALAASDAPARSLPRGSGRMWVLGIAATFCGLFLLPGFALQIQCYQCEEFQLNNDCSSPEFIVNCTVNVQDMCQKEVMEQSAGL
ncbi:ly6/PLAUR domain-containing protein 1 isoform X1 [Cavia porcellus]